VSSKFQALEDFAFMKQNRLLLGIAVALTSLTAMSTAPKGEAATYKPHVKWIKHTSANTTPVDAWIGSDGNLYELGLIDGPSRKMYLYRFDSNGHLKTWNLGNKDIHDRQGFYFALPEPNGTSIWKDGKLAYKVNINGPGALNESGNFVIMDRSGVLHIFSANGKSATVKIPHALELFLSPNGTSFVLTQPDSGKPLILYALNLQGKRLWSASVPDHYYSEAAISKDGQLYLLITEDYSKYTVYAYNTHGNLKWRYTFSMSNFPRDGFHMTVGSDGTLYIPQPNEDGTAYLTAVDPSGKVKWTTAVGQNTSIQGLTVQPNHDLTLSLGTVALGLSQETGKILWTKEAHSDYTLLDCTETKDGLIVVPETAYYYGPGGCGFYILDSAGHQKYFGKLPGDFLVRFPIAQDGTLFAVWDNNVEAFKP
jgi:hypothetical protein